MKRKLCLLLVFALTLVFLAGCGDYVEKASKGLDDYVIKLSYDEKSQTVSVAQTFTFKNDYENTFDKLKFNIFANAYRQNATKPLVSSVQNAVVYANGYSYGEIKFDKITVNGVDAAYSICGADSDVLEVPLGKTLYPSESVEIVMIYEIKLANVRHRLGYGENTVNLGNFFPILCCVENGEFAAQGYCCYGDPFVSEIANFEVSVIADEKLVVASSGELIETATVDGGVMRTYKAKAVRDFAMSLSEKYKTITKQVGEKTLNYYYYDQAHAEEIATVSAAAFEYFSKLMLEYPYATLSVAQTDAYYGGMEYPTYVTITPSDDLDEMYWSAVHEIAHQWIYGIVGSDQFNESWQDEGLTEFVTVMFFRANPEYNMDVDEYIKSRTQTYSAFVRIMTGEGKACSTIMSRPLNKFNSDLEYCCIAYYKGMLMFNDLNTLMGSQKFETGLKNYVKTNKLAIANPQDMFDSFSAAYGADLTEWFKAYLTGKDVLSEMK